MIRKDPALDEILGSLRVLFDAEKEVAQEVRGLEASAGCMADGQAELIVRFARIEALLADVLAGQADLRARLARLEGMERLVRRLAEQPPAGA